jgi:hypothetical protein
MERRSVAVGIPALYSGDAGFKSLIWRTAVLRFLAVFLSPSGHMLG